MSSQAATEKDSAAGVRPVAPWRVSSVDALPGYRLSVTFVDGSRGVVDLSRLVHSRNAGVYAVLLDKALFVQARLELGAVTWPGGVDLDPAWMHEEISRAGIWVAGESEE